MCSGSKSSAASSSPSRLAPPSSMPTIASVLAPRSRRPATDSANRLSPDRFAHAVAIQRRHVSGSSIRSRSSSQTTHAAEEAVDACRYFGGLLVGALRGVDKETLLSAQYCPVEGLWGRSPLAARIAAVAGGSFKHRDPPQIKGGFYVVETLEAALWAFHKSRGFRDGALLAANLGEDADTTAAVYGQIAGAYYGAEAIPAERRQQLAMATEITAMADSLHEHARQPPTQGGAQHDSGSDRTNRGDPRRERAPGHCHCRGTHRRAGPVVRPSGGRSRARAPLRRGAGQTHPDGHVRRQPRSPPTGRLARSPQRPATSSTANASAPRRSSTATR